MENIRATGEMSYNVLKEAAETLGIAYVGIKKEALVDIINENIEKRSSSLEVAMVQAMLMQAGNAPAESDDEVTEPATTEAAVEPTSEIVVNMDHEQTQTEVDAPVSAETSEDAPQTEEQTEEETTPASTPAPAAAPQATTTKPQTVSNGKKWYDEEPCLYNEGDKIEIIGGVLEGRFAIVNKPSNKKHAIKAFLIKKGSTTDELQNTNVTLDYVNIKLAAPAATETESGDSDNGQQVG